MIRKNIISVMGDMENFLDRLLAHTEEENCQHTVSDFLQEYFDNKNNNEKREAGNLPTVDTSAATPTTTNNPVSNKGASLS